MFVPFDQLSEYARVWIYQSSRPFTDLETSNVQSDLRAFVNAWTAHNVALLAYGDVWHDRFVVLMADESHREASGCSVDRSVHFLEDLERKYDVSLFERKTVVVKNPDSGEMTSMDLEDLKNNLENGSISLKTLVFDNLIKTKQQFKEEWMKPLEESWHIRFI